MRNGKALIDKIEYFMKHPEDEHSFCTMFSKEERDIWKTIREFEQIRSTMEPDKTRDARAQMGRGINVTERIFQKREQEREISFRLKRQLINQINGLLKQGKAEAWLDILAWYQLLKGKGFIIDKFWEFPVLEIMLEAFQEEWKLHYREGAPISLLSLRTMKELTDRYFTVVFTLRRIEYDVEPLDDLLYCLLEREVSLLVIGTILERARIFDKKKVRTAIDSWVGKQNG
jgi:hypothetical protein